METIPIP
nr:unknown [Medicago truncatula]